jgi:hypothetical protein
MNMKTIITHALVVVTLSAIAQPSTHYYAELPPYPQTYTAGTVSSRMIDGLGFRFYWATDGLHPEDLNFKPHADARTSLETVEHIYQMSLMIRNATTGTVNVAGQAPKLSFAEMRSKTLDYLKEASENLRASDDKMMNNHKVMSRRGDATSEFPFWNLINGPIADCLWHTGQIVSFRRSSGNPFNPNVNVFTGTVRK